MAVYPMANSMIILVILAIQEIFCYRSESYLTGYSRQLKAFNEETNLDDPQKQGVFPPSLPKHEMFFCCWHLLHLAGRRDVTF